MTMALVVLGDTKPATNVHHYLLQNCKYRVDYLQIGEVFHWPLAEEPQIISALVENDHMTC